MANMPDGVGLELEAQSLNATILILENYKGFKDSHFLWDAMDKWADLVVQEAQKTVRVRTGALKATIRKRMYEDAGGMVAEVVAGETGMKSAAVANYMHWGTTGHMVVPRTKKALHWIDQKTGEDRFSRGHFVRGVKADYFLEKAYLVRKAEGLELVSEALAKFMEASKR